MHIFDQLDEERCRLGKICDFFGLGPKETTSRIVFSTPLYTLKSYGSMNNDRPALLIVPAPIKRAYIWDLTPQISVVRRCMDNGLNVYLIQWEKPGFDAQSIGLAEYADRFILNSVNAIRSELDQGEVFLAGHSLGGTFSAIFSALHPERVRGLVLLAAPINFGEETGTFAPLLPLAPLVRSFAALQGNVPGSFLSAMSVLASPHTFLTARWMDWFRSLSDIQALENHLRVERWTLDESPLAQRLFEEVEESLYRNNRFMNGTLLIRGEQATPKSITSPILSVVEAHSPIVPPQSVLPFHDAVKGAEKKLLWYEGDIGVALQHMGMLVGKSAHLHLWPQILLWISDK